MFFMFREAINFNQDISAWNVSSVANMKQMFETASSFNQDMCDWGYKFGSATVTSMFLSSDCPTAGTNSGTPTSITAGWCKATSC